MNALAAELVGLLRRQGATLALAESCTGGAACARLTDVAGASQVLWGGAVVYSVGAKAALAGVAAEQVRRHGEVSEPTTRLLAEGIRRVAGCTMGLAVTGWAGPESAGPDPVGTVYLGVASPAGSRVSRLQVEGDRGRVREGATRALLELALEEVARLPIAEPGGGA